MKNRQGAVVRDLQKMLKNCSGDGPDSLASVLGVLQNFDDIKIAIEFRCGECCKTVSNGAFILPVPVGTSVLILLFPENDEQLLLKENCGGKVVKKELEFIVIPYEKISSFEFYEDEEPCFCSRGFGDAE